MKLLTITAAVVVLLYCCAVAVVLCPLPAAAGRTKQPQKTKEEIKEKRKESIAKKKQIEGDAEKQFEEVLQEFGEGKGTAAMTAALKVVGESLQTVQGAKDKKKERERVRRNTKRKRTKTDEQLAEAEGQFDAAKEELNTAIKELSAANKQLEIAMKLMEASGKQEKVRRLLGNLGEMVGQHAPRNPTAKNDEEKNQRLYESCKKHRARKGLNEATKELEETPQCRAAEVKVTLAKNKMQTVLNEIKENKKPRKYCINKANSDQHQQQHRHHHQQQQHSGDSTSRKRKADSPIRQQLDRRAGAAQALVTLDPGLTAEETAKIIDPSLRDAVHALLTLGQSPPSAVPQRSSQQCCYYAE